MVAVITLAPAIGANTLVFSVLDAVLWRPFPYPQPESLVSLWETDLEGDEARSRVTAANYLDWQARNRVFEQMAVFGNAGFNLTGGGEPELPIPTEIPRLADVRIDASAALFAFVSSTLAGILIASLPALRFSRPDLQQGLEEGFLLRTRGAGRWGSRGSLVVAEITVAVILAIGAGLLVQTYWRLRQVDPGFDPESVLVLDLLLPPSRYTEWHHVSAFHAGLIARIESQPGVRSAAVAYDHPLEATWYDSFRIEGRPPPEPRVYV